MTILAPMQSAALVLMGRKPAAFFSAPGRFEQEIADLVNEVAEDVAQYRDWTALQKTALLSADGDGAFGLPADYDRMMTDSEVQTGTFPLWGYFRYDDLSQFNRDSLAGFQSSPGGWIIAGGKMLFAPAPTGDTRFAYISKWWANGTAPQFALDTDEYLLPERLLKLGLIWRWRESKKLDGTGDQEAFVKALDEYAAKDGGSRVYRYGERTVFSRAGRAWPWALG